MGRHIIKWALAAAVVTGVGAGKLAAEGTKPEAPGAAVDPAKVSAEQARLNRQYQDFERDLLRVAQKLEKQGIEGQARAQMIYRALKMAREKSVNPSLQELSKLLKSPEYKNLQEAMDKGTAVKADLERLLAMLLAEDTKAYEKWIKEMLAMLNQASIMQAVAKARNQSPGVSKEEAEKAQKAATEQVDKIRQKFEDREKSQQQEGTEEKKTEPGEKGDPSESPRSEPKEGEEQDPQGKPKKTPPKGQEGEGTPPPPGSDPQEQDSQEPQEGQEQEKTPGRKQVQDANDYQKKAEEKLSKEERRTAADDQEEARRKLEEAKKRLEEILRQLREEEIERLLADLRARCEKMLRMQEIVYEETKRIEGRIASAPDMKPSREEEQNARLQAEKEDEIIAEVNRALDVLQGEGSAVAFPEVFEQVRNDMTHVSRRLARTDVGEETQLIEEDIITTLKEMIEALKKAQQDAQNRRNSGNPPPGGDQNKALIDLIAELKMIKSLQIRVHKRTVLWGKRYNGEQAQEPNIISELNNLAQRQMRIYEVTQNIAKGKNQ